MRLPRKFLEVQDQLRQSRGASFDLIDDAVNRYNRGEAMAYIAADYGVAAATLYSWLRTSGVQRRLVRCTGW
ncbi:MAG: hypothetical protein ACYC63_11055 [Armatimonadota bacterium]